jgi:hypothetical protein
MRAMPKFFLPLLAVLLSAQAALAELQGVYLGIGAAAGMRVELSATSDGYSGAFTDVDGVKRPFTAYRLDDTAETTMSLAEGPVFMRVSPEPIGARVVIVPFDAEGRLVVPQTRALAFLREGIDAPAVPERFIPAPTGPVRAMEARAFVSSYPFWEPAAAAWGYAAVEPRFRTVIRLFPLVQTDLLWKLCQGSARAEGLAEALRGQGVTCADVTGAIRAAQAGPTFDRFKRDVAAERAMLLTALGCADDLTRTQQDCSRAGAETARRALSMETAATVLSRYR